MTTWVKKEKKNVVFGEFEVVSIGVFKGFLILFKNLWEGRLRWNTFGLFVYFSHKKFLQTTTI